VQVRIKKFELDMDVKANGIEFEVRTPDGKSQVGDCYLTMTGLIWCNGKTIKKNGTGISWQELELILASDATKKAAIKAAKGI